MSEYWVGDPPFPFPSQNTGGEIAPRTRIYISDGTDAIPVEPEPFVPQQPDYSEVGLAHMAAMLEEREQKMQALVALTGMLYLFYKQQIQDESLGFEAQPEPVILKEIRDLVEKNFEYYRGLSRVDYCQTFERIVGNGKEKLIASAARTECDRLHEMQVTHDPE